MSRPHDEGEEAAREDVPLPAEIEAELHAISLLAPSGRERALRLLQARHPRWAARLEARASALARVLAQTATPGPGEIFRLTIDRVGPYRLGAKLGEGGMGLVYAAYRADLDRDAAVKLVRGSAPRESEVLRRFQREVKLHDRLQHPGIAKLFEAGLVRTGQTRVPWLAMELVEGALSITAYADHAGLAWPARLALFTTVAEAIAAAHRKQVLHRDIKPSNLLVSTKGVAKVIDFGIARDLDGALGITVTGEVHGTPAYMAPEQRDGRRPLDARCDVFALGMVLRELLGGPAPFASAAGGSADPAARARLPTALAKEAPGLHNLLRNCLAEDPASRYADASELAGDLHRLLADHHAGIRRIRRARRGLVLAAGAALLGAGAWFATTMAEPSVADIDRSVAQASALCDAGRYAEVGDLLAPMTSSVWSAAFLADHARRWLDVVPVGSAVGNLIAIAHADGRRWAVGLTGSGLVIRFSLTDAGAVPVRVPTPHDAAVRQLALSPEGTRLLLGTADGRVACMRVEPHAGDVAAEPVWQTAAVDGVSGPPREVTALAADPTGRWLAVGLEDGRIALRGLSDGRQLCTEDELRLAATAFAFGDGDRIAVTYRSGFLSVREVIQTDARIAWPLLATVAAGQELAKGGPRDLRSVAFLDAERVVLSGNHGRVAFYRLDGARLQFMHEFLDAGGDVESVAASEQGDWVAVGGTDGRCHLLRTRDGFRIGLLDVPGGRVRQVLRVHNVLLLLGGDGRVYGWAPPLGPDIEHGHKSLVGDLAFQPGSEWLGSASSDETVRVWSRDGRQRSTLRGPQNQLLCLAWSADGTEIAAGAAADDNAIRIWGAAEGECRATLRGHTNDVSGVAFLPEAGGLLSCARDGTVRRWDRAAATSVVLANIATEPTALVVEPGGAAALVGDGAGGLHRVELATGRTLLLHAHSQRIQCIAACARNGLVAAGANDGTLVLLADARAGASTALFTGGVIWDVAFTADGNEVLTVHNDGSIRVSSISGLRVRLGLPNHEPAPWSIALDDRQRLAIGTRVGPLLLHRLGMPTAERVAEAVGRFSQARIDQLVRLWATGQEADAAVDLRSLDHKLLSAAAEALRLEGNDPDTMGDRALAAVRSPNSGAANHAVALAQVQYALAAITPWRRAGLRAIEAATLLRLDRPREALAALAGSDARGEAWRESYVIAEAVAAMAHHRLGEHQLARAAADRLRALVQQDAWRGDVQAAEWLRQVEQALR